VPEGKPHQHNRTLVFLSVSFTTHSDLSRWTLTPKQRLKCVHWISHLRQCHPVFAGIRYLCYNASLLMPRGDLHKNNSHVFLRRHQFGRSHTQTWHSCPTVRHPASLWKLLPRGTQQSNEQEHQALHRIDATVRSCKVQSLPRSRRLHTYVSTALAIPTRRLIRDRCNTAPNYTVTKCCF